MTNFLPRQEITPTHRGPIKDTRLGEAEVAEEVQTANPGIHVKWPRDSAELSTNSLQHLSRNASLMNSISSPLSNCTRKRMILKGLIIKLPQFKRQNILEKQFNIGACTTFRYTDNISYKFRLFDHKFLLQFMTAVFF